MARTTTKSRQAWGAITQRGDSYEIRFRWGSKRVKRAVGASRAKAEKVLRAVRVAKDDGATFDEILQTVFGEVKQAGTNFADLVPAYLDVAAKTKKPSTISVDRARLGGITRENEWAKQDVATVSPTGMQEWIESRVAAGEKPSSVNRKCAAVSAVFKWAVKRGMVAAKPMLGVGRPSEKGNGRERYLTPNEIRAAKKACSDDLRPDFVTAVELGCRAGELRSLRWQDVDIKKGTLTLQAAYTKTGTSRVVHITPNVREALKGLEKGVRDAYVFTRDSTPWTKDGLIREWQAVRDAVPSLADARWHNLRHTSASGGPREPLRVPPVPVILDAIGSGPSQNCIPRLHGANGDPMAKGTQASR